MVNPFPDPNFTNPVDWWRYNNEVTNNWWGHFLLIIILVVIYATLDKKYPEIALAGSLFATLILAMVLWFMGVVPLYDLLIGLVLFTFVIIGNLWRKGY